MKNYFKIGTLALVIAVSFASCDPAKTKTATDGTDSLKTDSTKKDSLKADTAKKDTVKKDTAKKK